MICTLTLSNIYGTEGDKVGLRALDLARAFHLKFKVPLSFVVPNFVYEEFLAQSKLLVSVRRLCNAVSLDDKESLEQCYGEMKKLFSETELPPEFLESLKEAYRALSVSSQLSLADELLKEGEPIVNLIVSPNYQCDPEQINGVFLNIRGFDEFINALKSAWLSLYSPKAVSRRYKLGVKDFSVGVIVQSFVNADASAETWSKSIIGDYEIRVRSYFGQPDITNSLSKDEYYVSKEQLKIINSKIEGQEFLIKAGGSSGSLLKKRIGGKAFNPKISEKDVVEISRLTKKITLDVGIQGKSIFLVKGDKIQLFFIERTGRVEKTEESVEKVEEEESFQVVDESPVTQSFIETPSEINDEPKEEKKEEDVNGPERETEDVQEEKEELVSPAIENAAEGESRDPEGAVFDYVRMIAQIEPDLDEVLNRLYFNRFGIDPQDYMSSINDLADNLNSELTEDLLFVKTLKKRVQGGEVFALSRLTRAYDNVSEFIENNLEKDES